MLAMGPSEYDYGLDNNKHFVNMKGLGIGLSRETPWPATPYTHTPYVGQENNIKEGQANKKKQCNF